MAIKIKFDAAHNAHKPTFVLATRSGKKLGAIPARDISVRDGMNTCSEIFFSVYKEENGVRYHNWDILKDFKLVYCREWDTWFEISVELDESNSLVKNVSGKSLGESELSQINLYGIEINTENDILREDYEPTVLYNEDNASASLLDRMLDKAPHYRIKHVDISIANIQRTFSFDKKTIYDAFQEVATEIGCIFIIGSGSDADGKIDRTVSVYDLESFCLDCGHREEFVDTCPKCGSSNVLPGYGKDTSIFVSTKNLADNIVYSTDVGSVKNCFRLTAGDELMTAVIMSCNPNGSPYIWYISDEIREDMSQELVDKLESYDEQYNYYQKEYEVVIPDNLKTRYNDLVSKYSKYSDNLKSIPDKIVGFPALMTEYYNTIDFFLYLNNVLMPNAEIQDTNASLEAKKITNGSLTSVAVQDVNKVSAATASSAVLSMVKVIVDSRYRVAVNDSIFTEPTESTSAIWEGDFIITNYSDEEDTVISDKILILINDNYEEFVKQKIDKALNKNSDEAYDIVSLFKLNNEDFAEEIKKYSLERLKSFHDSCQSCLDILIEQGIADDDTWLNQTPDLYTNLYLVYYNKLGLLSEEISVRESEIAIIAGKFDSQEVLIEDGVQSFIDTEREAIQSQLDFENYLGEELWFEFIAYRREDEYRNENYISDGLDNAQLFQNALEFIEVANKEIFKSATLQHSISATLKNLLVMKEFSSIVDYFEVGNWIRAKVDGDVYKLRLLDYELRYNDLNSILVTFSDVKLAASGITDVESVLNQANSMASSYGTVSRQAGQGKKSSEQLDNWVTKGLALTKMKIVDNADNQNITWDSHGLLCKEYLPITDTYDEKQLKLINRGIYLTDDNWLTSRAGIGDFTFYNPQSGKIEETYGVIADTLVGNLILSEKVGIYNTKNSITLDENGLIITTNAADETSSRMSFTIQKKTIVDGNEVLTPNMYIDTDGNLVLNGSIRINSSTSSDMSSINDLADINRFNQQISNMVQEKTIELSGSINDRYDSVISYVNDQFSNYRAEVGQYMQYGESGLILGAKSEDGTESKFKTVIDNYRLTFKEDNADISWISGQLFYINNAVIQQTMMIGKFFFSPRADHGVSITWQDD